LARCPDAFASRVAAALQAIGLGRSADGIEELDRLVHETEAMR
jgi:hypothetical protein